MEKQGHDPVLIANFFIDLGPPDLTLLKLIKLCYIAHGFTLALTGKPLSKEPAGAWQYGPVFPSIYREFKHKNKIVKIKRHVEKDFSDDEKKIMKTVFSIYGEKPAWLLSEITHSKGSPWDETLKVGRSEIKTDLIQAHYKKKLAS